jgi:hypothetical protein
MALFGLLKFSTAAEFFPAQLVPDLNPFEFSDIFIFFQAYMMYKPNAYHQGKYYRNPL